MSEPKNQGQAHLQALVLTGFSWVAREVEIPGNLLSAIVADGEPSFYLRKRFERVGISIRAWDQSL